MKSMQRAYDRGTTFVRQNDFLNQAPFRQSPSSVTGRPVGLYWICWNKHTPSTPRLRSYLPPSPSETAFQPAERSSLSGHQMYSSSSLPFHDNDITDFSGICQAVFVTLHLPSCIDQGFPCQPLHTSTQERYPEQLSNSGTVSFTALFALPQAG